MKNLCLLLIIKLFLSSCTDRFLEDQPNSNILTPETVGDFQRLLDNFERVGKTSVLPQLAADEYYITSEANWISSRTSIEKNSYIWEKDVYGGEVDIDDWNLPYTGIFYANNIISQIDQRGYLEQNDKNLNDVYGQALFQRAYAYYDLVKNYSVPFDPISHETDLGVPLRTDPSIDYVAKRSSVKECYDQIFKDLHRSLEYLQNKGPLPERNRPTRLAVFALLSRIHHYRREYDQSEKWADEFLANYKELIDYNTLSTSVNTPFSRTNLELILYGSTVIYNNARANNTSKLVYVDTTLISLYDKDDLRLSIYFKMIAPGEYIMKAGYNGITLTPFNGLAVDEVILNKAEALCRSGQLDETASELNSLLVKRYRTGAFIPIKFEDAQQALDFVLTERRKELVWRCLRWDDIKRLNMEGAKITLRRIIGEKEYVLEPGSLRYTFNIPQDEINRSGIEQNKR